MGIDFRCLRSLGGAVRTRVQPWSSHVQPLTRLPPLVPATFWLVACVGDVAQPQPVDSGAGDATTNPTKDAALDTGGDVTDASVADAADAAVHDAADAAVEAEAGIPQPTCVDQTLNNGVGVHIGCQANPSSPAIGGTFALGSYNNSNLYGQPYCPIAYAVGSATVFQENGQTYFRFLVIRKTSTQDPGTPTTGTYWVNTNGNGDLTMVEMCSLQNKGLVKTGTLAVVGADYTITWKNGSTLLGQEKWTKQ